MSDGEERARSAEQAPSTIEPVSGAQPPSAEALAPRVRWIRAAALQVVAGGVAGFVVPIYYFHLDFPHLVTQPTNLAITIVMLFISAALVGLIGGGIPLLTAWISWLIVSRRRRRLRTEVLAVVLGALGGSVFASAPAFLYLAANGSPLSFYVVQILLIGGIPALAFALWVAAGWRRARKPTTDLGLVTPTTL
jgi:MFS family permease